jgi:hypothetical protein
MDDAVMFEFICSLGAAARIFTLRQVAQHPDLSRRTQPVKRASALLRRHPGAFESAPGPFGQPHRFWLSSKERRRRSMKARIPPANSARIEHWLAIGDLYLALGRFGASGKFYPPDKFLSEPEHSSWSDVVCSFGDQMWAIEIQRSALTEKQWRQKWHQKITYYQHQGYRSASWFDGRIPQPALILLTGQQHSTVQAPKGVRIYNSAQQFANSIRREKLVKK